MFYEIRRYTTRPGLRDAWVEYMESVVIPYQRSKGMVIPASFVDEEDDDGFVWLRRFDDEKQREAQYVAVYQTDEWRTVIGPRVGELIFREQIKVTRVVPTATSELQ